GPDGAGGAESGRLTPGAGGLSQPDAPDRAEAVPAPRGGGRRRGRPGRDGAARPGAGRQPRRLLGRGVPPAEATRGRPARVGAAQPGALPDRAGGEAGRAPVPAAPSGVGPGARRTHRVEARVGDRRARRRPWRLGPLLTAAGAGARPTFVLDE